MKFVLIGLSNQCSLANPEACVVEIGGHSHQSIVQRAARSARVCSLDDSR